jgi:threonine dehydratase
LIDLEEIRRARERLGASVLHTPLVQLDGGIWAKLECLQPIGSFKLRSALNAIRSASAEELADGVVTVSAGNMAQGVAWAAREAGVHARVIVPDTAPHAKLAAIERLGGELVRVSRAEWWQVMLAARYDEVRGLFIHPVVNDAVMAGNGTIGLELCDDLEELDTVIVPWGGGGLTTGVATAVKALRPDVRVVTAEPASGAAFAAAFAAGAPVEIEFQPSFVDGAGGPSLLPGMWERANDLVDEAVAVPLDEVEEAIRLLASRAHVVAEGAGALAVAAARGRPGRTACIVSGGNIDLSVLARVLAGA